ncbi:MAG: penicillin acylase family protein, partial [Proteobacteria bacterium]|nr:penicillin acylase family protein [Pseudomonadota bacterium]
MAVSRGRSINKFIVLSLALLIVLAAATVAWVYSSLPRGGGEVRVNGLVASATIYRDINAVPYIYADSEQDAAFALGFTHAQDRLWQMELQRRLGAGRLSEIMGTRTAAIDRQMRTLGFYRHAVDTLKGLSPEVLATFKAYADGINAWIAGRRGALPPEFLLLRHEPEPWQPADSVVWGKLMGMRLSGNFRGELLRARLAANLPPDRIRSLWPAYPADAPITVDTQASALPTKLLDQLLASYSILTDPPHGASNAWAIAGHRTKSGKPILANDPHLRFDAPILWYLARIKTPGLELTGATVPGVPQFLLGHNGHLAWGFTTTQSDLQDVFIEKIDPENPDRYLAPDGPKDFVSRNETIKVRDAEDI